MTSTVEEVSQDNDKQYRIGSGGNGGRPDRTSYVLTFRVTVSTLFCVRQYAHVEDMGVHGKAVSIFYKAQNTGRKGRGKGVNNYYVSNLG